MDIVSVLQKEVDKIAKEEYKHDQCPPDFTVSLLMRDDRHEIILTVEHLGWTFSEVIFPQLDVEFGYESLKHEMGYLYNRTM